MAVTFLMILSLDKENSFCPPQHKATNDPLTAIDCNIDSFFHPNANLTKDPREAMVTSKTLSIRQVSKFDIYCLFFGQTLIRRNCDRRDRIQFHKPIPPSTLDEPTTPPDQIRWRWDGWESCDLTGMRKKLNSKTDRDFKDKT